MSYYDDICSRERFAKDTATHAMTILRDDGLYRHLRFKRPNTSSYYFDIITWPGYLAITGDMGAKSLLVFRSAGGCWLRAGF